MSVLYINDTLQIPHAEFDFTFARSGGPGGQNVNKVNSKAVLRWNVWTTSSLPGDLRARFVNKYANRLTTEGDLILMSQKYRDQNSNIEDCLEKLKQMVEAVAVPPTPRRPTRPSFAAKQRRIEVKSQNSAKKQSRRAPRSFE